MTERFRDSEPTQEINHDQMNNVIDRLRLLAPYANQPVDQFGAYKTMFEHQDGEGYTTIYIPVMAGLEHVDGFVDDTYRIISRREEELNTGCTVVDTTTYGLRPTDMSTSYQQNALVYDSETGRPIQNNQQDVTIEQLNERIAIERAVAGPDYITTVQLLELERTLDDAEAMSA
jgi:hypothetical protein